MYFIILIVFYQLLILYQYMDQHKIVVKPGKLTSNKFDLCYNVSRYLKFDPQLIKKENHMVIH